MRPATCNCPTGATCHCTTQAPSLIHVLLSECCGTYALNGPITQQFESLAIGTQITVCGKLTAPSTWSGIAGDIWVTDWTTEQSFTLSLDPTSVTVNRSGLPTTVTVSVNSVGGFSMPVHLTVPSLPAGVSVSFSSNPVTSPSGGAVVLGLSIAASSSALEGSTVLTVTGTSGTLSTRSLTLTVISVTTTTVSPPPTNPQTTNATLEYDLTNRLTENGTTCTYEWGPMLAFYRTGDQFSFNYSSTSPIDVYVFDSYYYRGTVSCTLGPMLHAPYEPLKLTGTQGQFWPALCLGCEKEGGKGSFSYVLFINHDPTITPHVTLEVAVKLYAATTTTTVGPPPSAIPFIGVPEILIAILLGFFLIVKLRRRPH